MTMPMVMCHWASPATATGSARVDILGCSAALPCWCLTAGHWGVLCHQLRTAKCLQLSHPHLRKWSKKGNRTFLTLHLDTTCPQELYLFLSGTGPGTNPYFTDWGVILVVLFGAKHQCIAWNSRPKWIRATNNAQKTETGAKLAVHCVISYTNQDTRMPPCICDTAYHMQIKSLWDAVLCWLVNGYH